MFALQGVGASMNDVADAAGVARATVYRYFPTRDALVDELTRVSGDAVDARLLAARIAEVEPAEGVTRTVRALVDIGDAFVVLARERPHAHPHPFERQLNRPLRELLERGQASGDIRNDIISSRLIEALIGLVLGVLTSASRSGKEDTTATITGLFLDGARARVPRL